MNEIYFCLIHKSNELKITIVLALSTMGTRVVHKQQERLTSINKKE